MSLGTKSLSKKEQEDLKRRKDQEATAEVYAEFVASFEDSGKINKSWVKGGIAGDEARTKGGTKLYKPVAKVPLLSTPKEVQKEPEPPKFEDKPVRPNFAKKKIQEKKKSNLELFKEELKSIQELREERHALKRARGETVGIVDADDLIPPSLRAGPDFEGDPGARNRAGGGFNYIYGMNDTGDENTTNIYVGNINPKMQEKELCEIFGKFGPLASVKIMWPRTEEERSRGRNCGFVAFMNRKDGERAMSNLKGKEISSFEMKLGWGKAVPIPPHPIYIPPVLAELTQPPPPSGLPFNAQIKKTKDREHEGHIEITDNPEELEKTLANAVVKVVIPTERQLLALIHRMVEFVVREGPMFEAMIMNRELNNPFFRFLFENKSPAHTYYRWKLFSILHGDSCNKWRTEEFRMFKGGSIWRPPPIHPYTQGMPDDLVNRTAHSEFEVVLRKGKLTNSQRDRLEDMLRELTPERSKIADGMVWCLDHAEAAEEIVECISESLSMVHTPLPKKIARLFLVSDILFNSSAKVANASFYRKYFQGKLKEIFKDVNESYEKIEARMKAEQFKQKVMNCFRAWEDWAIYPNDFLINLQNIFLGLVTALKREESQEDKEELPQEVDGAPLEDFDGVPLSSEKIAAQNIEGDETVEDVDGLPIDPDVDGEPVPEMINKPPAAAPTPQASFFRSKWEEVDETELQAQAMTTSKWEMLEQEEEENNPHENLDEDIDGCPMEDVQRFRQSEESDNEEQHNGSRTYEGMANLKYSLVSEERRQKLREIEMKVVKYQDELEGGKRSRKSGLTLQEQIENYRRKLQRKFLDPIDSPQREGPQRKRYRSRSGTPPRSRGRSSDRSITPPKRKKKDKDRSPRRSKRSRSRSRSRSPRRESSRSPGRERKKRRSRKHRD